MHQLVIDSPSNPNKSYFSFQIKSILLTREKITIITIFPFYSQCFEGIVKQFILPTHNVLPATFVAQFAAVKIKVFHHDRVTLVAS